ncbi:MAG: hypothetical protein O7J95_17295 [Planctomycetota bacterium]|nr:hypothetical protein [Planctomycetota bacterium]
MQLFSWRHPPREPVDFSLPDDRGNTVVYDAAFRSRHNSVLVWYRGHW